MKLTDLAKDEKILEKTEVHGIIVDEFVVELPYHLKEIGLIAQKEDDGTLCFDLLDVALAFIANGVEVVLEVPFGFNMPEKDVLIIALNCGMSVSVMAPLTNNADNYAMYTEILCKYTDLWLRQPNATKMLFPSSGYLQYMVNEVFKFKTPDISRDDYIIEHFVDNMDISLMDEIKVELRKTIFNVFEGEDAFETFAHSLASSLSSTLISENENNLKYLKRINQVKHLKRLKNKKSKKGKKHNRHNKHLKH
jgi:hypothetical protein